MGRDGVEELSQHPPTATVESAKFLIPPFANTPPDASPTRVARSINHSPTPRTPRDGSFAGTAPPSPSDRIAVYSQQQGLNRNVAVAAGGEGSSSQRYSEASRRSLRRPHPTDAYGMGQESSRPRVAANSPSQQSPKVPPKPASLRGSTSPTPQTNGSSDTHMFPLATPSTPPVRMPKKAFANSPVSTVRSLLGKRSQEDMRSNGQNKQLLSEERAFQSIGRLSQNPDRTSPFDHSMRDPPGHRDPSCTHSDAGDLSTAAPALIEAKREKIDRFTMDALSAVTKAKLTNERLRRINQENHRHRLYFHGALLSDETSDEDGWWTSLLQAAAQDPSWLKKKFDSSTVLIYRSQKAGSGSDVWPDLRDAQKVPLRYAPLSTPTSSPHKSSQNHSRNVQRSSDVRPLVRRGAVWPKDELPAELFVLITNSLSRDDIKAMRLTCKEFEKQVSHCLFSTVVVPFNTEIYGMIESDYGNPLTSKHHAISEAMGLAVGPNRLWKNSKSDDIYAGHGINVYKGFGPHIQRYGMSFEVDENALARTPNKRTQEVHKSYWGTYLWPFQEYRRFERTADLEVAADETPKMKEAFSYLMQVKELALSLDSGLGWLRGPDTSLRARILGKPAPVFGPTHTIPDRQTCARRELWRHLQNRNRKSPGIDLRHANLEQTDFSFLDTDFDNLLTQHQSKSASDNMWLDARLLADLKARANLDAPSDYEWPEELASSNLSDEQAPASDPSSRGLLFVVEDQVDEATPRRDLVVPSALTKLQKEWLLETEWAQCAFLSSYMIAIIDNPATFENVHTLNLARISSRYIGALNRRDFWESLPNLRNVTIMAIADWREVQKDPAGFVETPTILPSNSLDPFHALLRGTVANLRNIKTLAIGWASGGEHAEGVHARNKHLLVAPLFPATFEEHEGNQLERTIVVFPFVEHLTLENCWLTPFSLTMFAKKHQDLRLRKLTLKSVSLTVPPGVPNVAPNQNQNNNNAPAFPVVHPNFPAAQAAALGIPPPIAPPAGNGAVTGQHGTVANGPAIWQQLNAANAQGGITAVQNVLQLHGQTHAGGVQAQLVFNAWLFHNHMLPPRPLDGSDWRSEPREGSWPWILDILSPGRNFRDIGLQHSHADPARIAASALAEIELVSCGYAKIHSAGFDNTPLDEPAGGEAPPPSLSAYFSKRAEALAPCMLKATDQGLGTVVQWMPPRELVCLAAVWGCTRGWESADADALEEPTFDGALPGGSGRFNGRIRRSDRDELTMDQV